MVVSEIMTRGVRTVAPGATLLEAASIMGSSAFVCGAISRAA